MDRVLLALALSIAACEDDGLSPPELPIEEEVIRAPAVTVVTLAQDPGPHDGQTVRIVGEAAQVLAPRALVVEGRGLLWAAKIPVVAGAPVWIEGRALAEGDHVEVVGLVHARVSPELAAELSRELGPKVAAALGPGPVLIARSIREQGRRQGP